MICELLLANRIAITPAGRKSLVDVVDRTPLDDGLIDEWLCAMAESNKDRKLEYWLKKIAATQDLKRRVAQKLVEREILEEAEDKFLFLFHRTRYPESDAGPEREVRERLPAAIYTDTTDIEPPTVAILSLAQGHRYSGARLR